MPVKNCFILNCIHLMHTNSTYYFAHYAEYYGGGAWERESPACSVGLDGAWSTCNPTCFGAVLCTSRYLSSLGLRTAAAAAMGAGMINSLGSIPFSSGREEVLMFGPQFNRSALR